MGILTVAVVTRPFPFEGKKRMLIAEEGIRALAESVDSLITIPNEKLLTILGKDASLLSAFAKAEDPNSGGRQMPGHFGQKKNRILTGSSPVTTQLPHAVGVALAGKMKKQDLQE